MSKGKNHYPLFILLLIGSFISFLIWSALQAAHSGPQVTDADYYSKGLRYTSTILEKKAAEVLGWNLSTRVEGRTLAFYLEDKDGQPVRSAKGIISMYRPESETSLKFALQEDEAGRYLLHMTDSMDGEITARIEFERDGARLNRQLLLSL